MDLGGLAFSCLAGSFLGIENSENYWCDYTVLPLSAKLVF